LIASSLLAAPITPLSDPSLLIIPAASSVRDARFQARRDNLESAIDGHATGRGRGEFNEALVELHERATRRIFSALNNEQRDQRTIEGLLREPIRENNSEDRARINEALVSTLELGAAMKSMMKLADEMALIEALRVNKRLKYA